MLRRHAGAPDQASSQNGDCSQVQLPSLKLLRCTQTQAAICKPGQGDMERNAQGTITGKEAHGQY